MTKEQEIQNNNETLEVEIPDNILSEIEEKIKEEEEKKKKEVSEYISNLMKELNETNTSIIKDIVIRAMKEEIIEAPEYNYMMSIDVANGIITYSQIEEENPDTSSENSDNVNEIKEN